MRYCFSVGALSVPSSLSSFSIVCVFIVLRFIVDILFFPRSNSCSCLSSSAVVNVIGMSKCTPPIKDLLTSLTPILKNRHEKVQENCIDLVGRIADRGSEFVPLLEWMRISFELLDMLKVSGWCLSRFCLFCSKQLLSPRLHRARYLCTPPCYAPSVV